MSSPLLEQVSQLLQGSDIVKTLQERVRQEVIRPAIEEHKAKTDELYRVHSANITGRVMSKLDMTQQTMAAISRWADNIKKDVDPGLLLPATNAQPPQPSGSGS